MGHAPTRAAPSPCPARWPGPGCWLHLGSSIHLMVNVRALAGARRPPHLSGSELCREEEHHPNEGPSGRPQPAGKPYRDCSYNRAPAVYGSMKEAETSDGAPRVFGQGRVTKQSTGHGKQALTMFREPCHTNCLPCGGLCGHPPSRQP